MSVKIHVGDCREVMKGMKAGWFHACITSPPYFSLRDYGVDGQIGLEETPQEYVATMVEVMRGVWRVLRDDGILFLNLGSSYASSRLVSSVTACGNDGKAQRDLPKTDRACPRCDGEHRGGYPNHLSHTRRTCQAPLVNGVRPCKTGRDNAPLDSGQASLDASAPGAQVSTIPSFCGCVLDADDHEAMVSVCPLLNGSTFDESQECAYRLACTCDTALPSQSSSHRTSGTESFSLAYDTSIRENNSSTLPNYTIKPPNFKPKDLIPIPWMVALALQADGWYLRSAMPWIKFNPMPESVTDRVTTAHEYIFMLSKSKRYFYDGESIKVGAVSAGRDDGTGHYRGNRQYKNEVDAARLTNNDNREAMNRVHATRNRRTSDTFRESLAIRIADQRAYLAHLEHVQANGGMLLSEDGTPAALLVNTAAFKGKHFAVFPTKLVQPLIAAGTSEKGCCPECGASWVRMVEKGNDTRTMGDPSLFKSNPVPGDPRKSAASKRAGDPTSKTTGWIPGCACSGDYGKQPDPIPCRVFDPFMGAGTTLLQADRMGRDAEGIELNAEYAEMARERVEGDAPMFVDVEILTKSVS